MESFPRERPATVWLPLMESGSFSNPGRSFSTETGVSLQVEIQIALFQGPFSWHVSKLGAPFIWVNQVNPTVGPMKSRKC